MAALRKAGLNIYDPADIAKVSEAFKKADMTLDPAAHIPWHLTALMTELEYVQEKLAERGVQASLGECARVLYPNAYAPDQPAFVKMLAELEALDIEHIMEQPRQEIVDAIQISFGR